MKWEQVRTKREKEQTQRNLKKYKDIFEQCKKFNYTKRETECICDIANKFHKISKPLDVYYVDFTKSGNLVVKRNFEFKGMKNMNTRRTIDVYGRGKKIERSYSFLGYYHTGIDISYIIKLAVELL